MPQSPDLAHQVQQLGIPLAQGYTSEINLNITGWLSSLSELLTAGLVLLIDYGYPRHEYYHPNRHRGTLMCHYHHRAHDNPFILFGLQDVTAHVDFTALTEAAIATEFTVSGYTTQAHFLLNCGITQLLELIPFHSPERLNANQHTKILTLPSEMGELYKAMALTKNIDLTLLGFHRYDLRRKIK